MSGYYKESCFTLNAKLCDYLIQSPDDIALIIDTVREINISKNQFFFTGDYQSIDNKILPVLFLHNDTLLIDEEDFKSLIYIKINEYICSILNNNSYFTRSKPWLKPYSDFSYNPYESFIYDYNCIQKISSNQTTNYIFQGIEVELIQTIFNSQMIIPKEFLFLHEFSHPFIIPTLGVCKNNQEAHVIIIKGNGTLKDLILNSIITFEEKVLLMQQLAKVVWFLHSKRVLISGIFPEKVLIFNSPRYEIGLYDFSNAEILEQGNDFVDCESAHSSENFPSGLIEDIYFLGLTYYFIVTGKYYEINDDVDMSDKFISFIMEMISNNEKERPNIVLVNQFLQVMKIE